MSKNSFKNAVNPTFGKAQMPDFIYSHMALTILDENHPNAYRIDMGEKGGSCHAKTAHFLKNHIEELIPSDEIVLVGVGNRPTHSFICNKEKILFDSREKYTMGFNRENEHYVTKNDSEQDERPLEFVRIINLHDFNKNYIKTVEKNLKTPVLEPEFH